MEAVGGGMSGIVDAADDVVGGVVGGDNNEDACRVMVKTGSGSIEEVL